MRLQESSSSFLCLLSSVSSFFLFVAVYHSFFVRIGFSEENKLLECLSVIQELIPASATSASYYRERWAFILPDITGKLIWFTIPLTLMLALTSLKRKRDRFTD